MHLSTLCKIAAKEVVEWLRAALQHVPGRIGEWTRNRFYGFRAGAGTRVLRGVIIYHPEGLRIGDNVGISSNCQLNAIGGITIGSNVLIGPGTFIWTQNHNFVTPSIPIRLQGYTIAPVVLEDDVWIAAGCIILPGVTISKGSVVAAGAVVTKSTTPFSVNAGVPARQLSKREQLDDGTVARESNE